MKSKAPLLLMEQMVMLLVFALAAALCLQAFVKSDSLSRRSEERDQAVILCQTAAETIRACRGSEGVSTALGKAAEKLGYNIDHGILYQEFDEDWNPVDFGVYCLDAEGVPTEVSGLRAVHVAVMKGFNAGQEMEILFEIEIAWQEEVGGYAG